MNCPLMWCILSFYCFYSFPSLYNILKMINPRTLWCRSTITSMISKHEEIHFKICIVWVVLWYPNHAFNKCAFWLLKSTLLLWHENLGLDYFCLLCPRMTKNSYLDLMVLGWYSCFYKYVLRWLKKHIFCNMKE